MKKAIIYSIAVSAAAAAAFYYMRKKAGPTMHADREVGKRSHHKTDVFAKAKP
ncbi:MAG: hypothetical protein ABIN36_17015 [Ferruginibacter sp.]